MAPLFDAEIFGEPGVLSWKSKSLLIQKAPPARRRVSLQLKLGRPPLRADSSLSLSAEGTHRG